MTKQVTERELVLAILMEVTQQNVYSHLALNAVLEKYQYLEKKERAFITRVTEGTLEHMIELDYILNQFSKVKVNKMKLVIRNILRSAVYQLKYMDSVPDSAVCNEAVKLAVKKGFGTLRGFVNGVLRNVARGLDQVEYPTEGIERLSVVYSMPEWILKLWKKTYDLDVIESMLQAFQEETPVTIRCNLAKTTPENLKESLQKEGVTVTPHPYLSYAFWIQDYDHLSELESFQKGEFYVQDISSMLVGELADPKKGDRVIDVCAAPGGKSLHAAELLAGTGLVEARDLSDHKVSILEENIRRMGLANIRAEKWDATILNEESIGQADVVICDAPCSGLGVVAKKPDIKYHMTKETQKELAILQRQILDVVCAYVKAGGTLMYSTCTISSQENEDNVTWFLEKHPDFSLETEKQFLPKAGKQDGFFLAKMKKR